MSATVRTGRPCHATRDRVCLLACWLAVLILAAPLSLQGQSPITFRYFYDDAGQLQKVVDSTGVVLEYVYDPVGNILEIKRSASPTGGLAILSFTPGQGGPLTTVAIRGQGFASTPTGNVVKFNGTAATVVAATSDTLNVNVPIGATSGPISVAVGTNTATSSSSFIVPAIPVITSLTPTVIDVARPPAVLLVTGVNLAGTSFALLPVLQASPVTLGPATVNGDGTGASLQIGVVPSARGPFTLVATNTVGSSTGFPSGRNTIWVISVRDATDTDGDGYPDSLELQLGSDPLDPDSVPNPFIGPGEIDARAVVVLNNAGVPDPTTNGEADATPFSALNLGGITGGQPLRLEADGLVSVLNTDASAPPAARNGSDPGDVAGGGGGGGGQPMTMEADAVPFSVNNLSPNAPTRAAQAARTIPGMFARVDRPALLGSRSLFEQKSIEFFRFGVYVNAAQTPTWVIAARRTQ